MFAKFKSTRTPAATAALRLLTRMPSLKAPLTANKAHQLLLNPLSSRRSCWARRTSPPPFACSTHTISHLAQLATAPPTRMAKLYVYFSSLKLLGSRLPAPRSASVRRYDSGNQLRSSSLALLPLNSAFCSPLDPFARHLASTYSALIDLYNSGDNLPHSQPSEGLHLTYDDRAGLDGRAYLHSPAQPTRSPTSLNSSPRPQPGWQSSTSTSHRSNFSASTASPLLAPPQFAAATPATNFASSRPSSYRSTQPSSLHSKSSLDASSLLTPAPSISTTHAAPAVRPRSSSKCSAPSATPRSTSHRQHGVSAHSQPSEGLHLTYDDRAGLDGRAYLHSPAQPTRSPTSLNSSPRLQAGWQSSVSTSHRSNFSATASPLLAPPQFAAATPATNFASSRPSSYRSTQPSALHSTSSLDTSSLLTPPPSISTTPAAPAVRPRSSSKSSAPSASPRSTYSPKVSSPLAAPRSVVTVPPATFYPARSPPSTTPRATRSLHTSALLVPPQPVTTTPATEHSLAFSSHRRSNPSSDLSPSQHLIADLEETAASLQRQYDASERGVHSMIQYHVFPYTMSLADDAKKAKTELDEVMEKIAAVDRECAELEALFQDECNKFLEAEEALRKAQSILEETDMEQAELLATVHELQAGQPVNGVWVERVSEPLDSTSPQCVAEQAEEYRGASSKAHNSSQGAKKAVKSWESRCNPPVALQRYSIPRAAQTAPKSDEEGHRSKTDQGQGAKPAAPNPSMWVKHGPGLLAGASTNGPSASTPQAPVTTSNESEQQNQAPVGRKAHLAYTSDYFGRPLRWGQLALDSAVDTRKPTTRSSKHA